MNRYKSPYARRRRMEEIFFSLLMIVGAIVLAFGIVAVTHVEMKRQAEYKTFLSRHSINP
jgi:hypothetical protein